MSYPVNLNVEGKPILVVGGGAVASRKVLGLLEAGAEVTMVAPAFEAALEELEAGGHINLRRRPFKGDDLDGVFLAFAATNNESVNESVSKEAALRGILVNVADQPQLCTFTLPAVLRRGGLTIAVATNGDCPAFAGTLREELESRYGVEYGPVLEFFGRLRRRLIKEGWESARIKDAVSELYDGGIADLISQGDEKSLEFLLVRTLGSDRFFPPEG